MGRGRAKEAAGRMGVEELSAPDIPHPICDLRPRKRALGREMVPENPQKEGDGFAGDRRWNLEDRVLVLF